MRAILFAALVLIGCDKRPAPERTDPIAVDPVAAPTVAKAAPDIGVLATLPTKDLVGYLSGNYQTQSNNPGMYVDRERKVFVMMTKRGAAEVALDKPAEAIAAFESLLVANGYAANGKQPTDDHQKVMVNGQEMVVMSTAELFPEMPAELKAHFTEDQHAVLYNTTTTAGYQLVATRSPVIWGYSKTLVVQNAAAKQEFPIEKASDAFAAFRKLL